MSSPSPSPSSSPLWPLVETWHRACGDFLTLVRGLTPADGELPTDLAGWTVKDNVAHTAHLEAVLAGAPEETIHVEPAPHLRGVTGYYTEQGVLARRGRSLAELADELEAAVATRWAALCADPPMDPHAAPPKTPGDVGWDTGTLLSNRPLDVWMHEQDVRRATGRPGGWDSPAAAHVVGVLARALPMVLGKRLAPPPGTSVRLVVGDRAWTARVGEDGRAARADDVEDPTATVTLSPEAFVVLGGGRRTADDVEAKVEGDQDLGRRLLSSLAVTP
jgi:uncharacterized protein (TIGR03083 family)